MLKKAERIHFAAIILFLQFHKIIILCLQENNLHLEPV